MTHRASLGRYTRRPANRVRVCETPVNGTFLTEMMDYHGFGEAQVPVQWREGSPRGTLRPLASPDQWLSLSARGVGSQVGAAIVVRGLDLRQVAAASVEALESQAAKKGVLVDLDFEDRLPLEGDEGLLHQVVRKLLDNAVKYSSPGGRVVVRGRSRGDEVRLEVEDRGIGIAPEHLPRIFEFIHYIWILIHLLTAPEPQTQHK